jgi:hypothetical protein
MENKELFNNIVKLINRATPSECTIRRYITFNGYTSYRNLSIFNFRNDYLEIRTNRDEKGYTLQIASSRGGQLKVYISELEFTELNIAILKCYERFDSVFNMFCETFY